MPDSSEYYAVIFTSEQHEDAAGYDDMAERMSQLAAQQPGFLGMESARSTGGLGITVSYWRDRESITHWKRNAEHQAAQQLGREKWYRNFRLRIARVVSDRQWRNES